MSALFYNGFSATDIDRFESDLAWILANLQRHLSPGPRAPAGKRKSGVPSRGQAE
jgi:hypothetical protein